MVTRTRLSARPAAALTIGLWLFGFLTTVGWAQSVFDRNLIVNGDGETGAGSASGTEVVPWPGWTTTGNLTVVRYGAPDFPDMETLGPSNRGSNFMAGGPGGAESAAKQTIAVTDGAGEIDSGRVTFTFTAYLGGYLNQTDQSKVTAVFFTAEGSELGQAILGPVTMQDRTNQLALLERRTEGKIPVGTRQIEITVQMTEPEGFYNDGYADNMSLILSQEGGSAGVNLSIFRAVEITWLSEIGVRYQVQWATSLPATNWFNLGSPISGTGAVISVHDRVASETQRTYRVESLP